MTPISMPMFPLGTVLFPRGVLPLHVFESRYLEMVDDVTQGDSTFGVVLIERGSEVGGGDHRFSVGCAARIVRTAELEEDRLAVIAVGLRRIRVVNWLPEDPYPVADVVEIVEPEAGEGLEEAVDRARNAYRRTMALASELGLDVGDGDLELHEDRRAAAWHLATAAPVEQLDRQRLLEMDDAVDRMHVLADMLGDRSMLLEARLAGG
jgi:Lon protease-like protein